MGKPDNSDLSVRLGAAEDVQSYLTTWPPYFMVKAAFDKAWAYQLFPWEKILVHPLYESFVACDNARNIEGMIAFGRAGLALPDAANVAFLSTAPWNYGEGRLRRNIGTGLIAFAVRRSTALGFGGTLVLASTRESETFYERLLFERTGDVDSEGLAVFRLPTAKAAALLQKYAPLREEK